MGNLSGTPPSFMNTWSIMYIVQHKPNIKYMKWYWVASAHTRTHMHTYGLIRLPSGMHSYNTHSSHVYICNTTAGENSLVWRVQALSVSESVHWNVYMYIHKYSVYTCTCTTCRYLYYIQYMTTMYIHVSHRYIVMWQCPCSLICMWGVISVLERRSS